MLSLKAAVRSVHTRIPLRVRHSLASTCENTRAAFSTSRYRTPHATPMSDMEIIRISERVVTPGYEETVKEVMEKVRCRTEVFLPQSSLGALLNLSPTHTVGAHTAPHAKF